jgi:hypothetical protein
MADSQSSLPGVTERCSNRYIWSLCSSCRQDVIISNLCIKNVLLKQLCERVVAHHCQYNISEHMAAEQPDRTFVAIRSQLDPSSLLGIGRIPDISTITSPHYR